MALNINNFAQLKKFQKALTPADCLDDAKTARVTLHTAEDSEHLPQLHMEFRPVHFVSLDPSEVKEAKKLGYKVEKDTSYDGKEKFHTYAQERETRHLWFMNFRRYGWCFTSEEAGEYGYGYGEVYANGPSIYHLATTPAEKIRDAMVRSWSAGVAKKMVPQYFDDPEIHALLAWMLEDAILHSTEHASIYPARKGWGNVKVVVDPNPPKKAA